jgi:hypothetical protein
MLLGGVKRDCGAAWLVEANMMDAKLAVRGKFVAGPRPRRGVGGGGAGNRCRGHYARASLVLNPSQ